MRTGEGMSKLFLDTVVSLRSSRLMPRTVLVMALFMLSACASLMLDSDAIRVNLSSLQVMEIRLLEQRFLADIRIRNRTRKPFDVVKDFRTLQLSRIVQFL